MRGTDKRSGELFSYVDLERRVRADHPLRAIRTVVSEALDALSGEFAMLYSGMGRPSIAPEMLLRAMLLQAFYSVRSERQLMERLEYDLLFRWFVGLGVDEPVWDHSTFSKNRDRLLDGDVAARFLSAILAQPRVGRLLSNDHFTVDGTLIEAWAEQPKVPAIRSIVGKAAEGSMKSFRPRDEPDRPTVVMAGATRPSTSGPRSAPTPPTPAPPIPMRCSTARDPAWRRSSASSATALWRTAQASWSTPGSRACSVTPSASPRWR